MDFLILSLLYLPAVSLLPAADYLFIHLHSNKSTGGEVTFPFLDAIASPSTYPRQSVGQWVSESVIVSDLEICSYRISELCELGYDWLLLPPGGPWHPPSPTWRGIKTTKVSGRQWNCIICITISLTYSFGLPGIGQRQRASVHQIFHLSRGKSNQYRASLIEPAFPEAQIRKGTESGLGQSGQRVADAGQDYTSQSHGHLCPLKIAPTEGDHCINRGQRCGYSWECCCNNCGYSWVLRKISIKSVPAFFQGVDRVREKRCLGTYDCYR